MMSQLEVFSLSVNVEIGDWNSYELSLTYVQADCQFDVLTVLTPSNWNPETNDTSFESPNKKLLESGENLALASSSAWPRPLN